jgi:hypothetical protein
MPNAWQDIDALIERRALQLRKVDQKMERWLLIDGRIVAIDQALAALRNHPDANVELFGSVLRDLRKQVAELLEGYSRLAARFARQSVAIGVSGPARVGKTALIQTLSGLEDEQIPTGRGWLVIAPRIRFDHTKGRPRAVVQFHSEESFLKAVIDPLHSELGFLAMPASLNEFEAWRYPAGDEVRALVRPALVQLLDLHARLASYRDDLTGGEMEVPFEELRAYLAYPDLSEPCSVPKYATVRGIRIECQFPYDYISKLSIVDLPGFGSTSDAEQSLIDVLRDEVDAVLLVKRPVEGMAYLTHQDVLALDLLSEAAGPIKRLTDFVYIIANRFEGDSSDLMAAMEDSIRRYPNGGEDGRFFTVWQVNPCSTDDVSVGLLAPLLVALTERLPAMDRDLLDAASAQAGGLTRTIRAEIVELEQALPRLSRHVTGQTEDLREQKRRMEEDISVGLGHLMLDLEFDTHLP